MKTLNSFDAPLDLNIGLYKIGAISRFEDASRFPLAKVNHKRDVSFTAIKEAVFYLNIEGLYHKKSIGPKHLFPTEINGKIIHVRRIDVDREIVNGKLQISQVADWEIIDRFKLYDLYKQQGEGLLVVPQEDMDEYDELEMLKAAVNAEYDDAIEQQQIIDADSNDIDYSDDYEDYDDYVDTEEE